MAFAFVPRRFAPAAMLAAAALALAACNGEPTTAP